MPTLTGENLTDEDLAEMLFNNFDDLDDLDWLEQEQTNQQEHFPSLATDVIPTPVQSHKPALRCDTSASYTTTSTSSNHSSTTSSYVMNTEKGTGQCTTDKSVFEQAKNSDETRGLPPLPPNATPQEKAERRRIRNRISATEHRQKTENYITMLEAEVTTLRWQHGPFIPSPTSTDASQMCSTSHSSTTLASSSTDSTRSSNTPYSFFSHDEESTKSYRHTEEKRKRNRESAERCRQKRKIDAQKQEETMQTLLARVEHLERDNAALLSDNQRLSEEIAQYKNASNQPSP